MKCATKRIVLQYIIMVLTIQLLGCSTPEVTLTPEARAQMTKRVEDLMIVDCLLPGQLRKLGGQATYLTARRPIKTSAVDCEIRGGEYVAFDRANYATALKVWLPFANEGDPKAQTYVGEIYEKGAGVSPDYPVAALWYQRAADQGFARAQINLGHLYEKGRGVIQDSAKAMSLYRAASGLKEDELAYAATIASTLATVQMNQEELAYLKALALQKDEEIQSLKRELSSVEVKLQILQREASEAHQQIQSLEDTLKQSKVVTKPFTATQQNNPKARERLKNEITHLRQLLQEEQRRSDQEVFQFAEEVQALAEQKRLVIAALEEQLQLSRSSLLEKELKIKTLKQRSSGYQKSIKVMEVESVELVEGPAIEIIDPPMTLTRGHPTVQLRSSVSMKEIIGKVTAPAGLATFKINDHAQPIDQYNLFWAEIPILRADNPVEIVAVDQRGRRASVSFSLQTNALNNTLNNTLIDSGANMSWRDPSVVDTNSDGLATDNLKLGQYYALVIGNNNYKNFSKLQTAVSDAKETAALLKNKYGYQTTLLLNANRYTLLSELNRLRSELTEKDNLLVYYAGHGELDRLNQRGYWLPIDAERTNTANWISNVAISDIFNATAAKHVMVVADSCYAGTLSSSSVARSTLDMPPEAHAEWVKVMAKTRARTVLTSGGVAPVLDGGGGNHSVFANAFLEVLRDNKGLLEGYGLYRQVLEKMRTRSMAVEIDQVPDYAPIKHAGHEAGEFFFSSKQRDS